MKMQRVDTRSGIIGLLLAAEFGQNSTRRRSETIRFACFQKTPHVKKSPQMGSDELQVSTTSV